MSDSDHAKLHRSMAPMRLKLPELALRTSLVYIIAGGLWILLSDYFLNSFVPDGPLRDNLQTYKGWGFVFATGMLLYVGLRKQLRYRDREVLLRKRTSEELKESEQKYRLIAENVSDVIWVVDLSTMCIQYISPSVESLLGYTPDELIGRESSLMLAGDSLASWKEHIARRVVDFVEGTTAEFVDQIEHRRKNGGSVWTETKTRFAVNASLGHNELHCISRDITERRAIEANLRERARLQQQLSHITETVPGMICSIQLDQSGRMSMPYVSQNIEEVWGCRAAEVANDATPLVRRIVPEDRERFLAAMKESARTEKPWHEEYRVNHPTKGEIWIEGHSMPHREPEGNIVWHGFQADVTERKHGEAHLKSSLHEKEVLLKEVHHRVRNNLQVISSLLNIQADAVMSPESQAALKESQYRIRSMALVHEKLYSSGNLASVQFGDYMTTVVNELLRSYGKGNVRKLLELDPIYLEVDKAIPCGLIVNELVTNALRHAFPNGREGTLTVTLKRRAQGMVTFTICDDGIGFPSDKDFGTMSSMGMTLLNALLQQIGGTATLDRTAGTAFTIVFPG